jgi:hypothetical protein
MVILRGAWREGAGSQANYLSTPNFEHIAAPGRCEGKTGRHLSRQAESHLPCLGGLASGSANTARCVAPRRALLRGIILSGADRQSRPQLPTRPRMWGGALLSLRETCDAPNFKCTLKTVKLIRKPYLSQASHNGSQPPQIAAKQTSPSQRSFTPRSCADGKTTYVRDRVAQ